MLNAFRGSKTNKKLDDLGVCTLYFFRLCFLTSNNNNNSEDDDGNYTSEWLSFKAGTDCGPYLVMHMTRALKTGNTSMIRKLAQLRLIS